MEGVLKEIENMLARGQLDLPLILCFAVIRGDDLLLHQLLRRGLDPNESDNNGHTALHIAALKGNEHCVRLLLDYGADPNCRDSEGVVPIWEAMVGKHEDVVRLLIENGAHLSSGDVGLFACLAAEKNSLDLLKEIVLCGGNVTAPKKDGTTALHLAVCEGNAQIVEFLLEQGADIDKPDYNGWTPRTLADQQGHEEIKALFETKKAGDSDNSLRVSTPPVGSHFIGRYNSEPVIPQSKEERSSSGDFSWSKRDQRRNANFHNSLFGVLSAARHVGRKNQSGLSLLRVTISCPEKGNTAGKLVLMPDSLRELLDIGSKKFDFVPSKVLMKDGGEVDDVRLIRDGDHLVLVSDAWMQDGNHS